MNTENRQPSTADVIDLGQYRAARGGRSEAPASTDLIKAAERGDAEAQAILGACYQTGEHVPQSDTEAVKWWRKAAEQGHAFSQCSLGISYMKGSGGVPEDPAAAAEWWRKASEQGSSTAQALLGFLYMDGNGVAKDRRQAYILLSLALAARDRLPAKVYYEALKARKHCLEKLDAEEIKAAQEEAGHRWRDQLKRRDRP